MKFLISITEEWWSNLYLCAYFSVQIPLVLFTSLSLTTYIRSRGAVEKNTILVMTNHVANTQVSNNSVSGASNRCWVMPTANIHQSSDPSKFAAERSHVSTNQLAREHLLRRCPRHVYGCRRLLWLDCNWGSLCIVHAKYTKNMAALWGRRESVGAVLCQRLISREGLRVYRWYCMASVLCSQCNTTSNFMPYMMLDNKKSQPLRKTTPCSNFKAFRGPQVSLTRTMVTSSSNHSWLFSHPHVSINWYVSITEVELVSLLCLYPNHQSLLFLFLHVQSLSQSSFRFSFTLSQLLSLNNLHLVHVSILVTKFHLFSPAISQSPSCHPSPPRRSSPGVSLTWRVGRHYETCGHQKNEVANV